VFGNVTIARGHLLRTAEAALLLPWNKRYSTDLIRHEFAKVLAMVPADKSQLRHRGARFYENATALRLTADESLQVTETDVEEFIHQLARALPEYHTYPIGPQFAILDLAYNCGVHGFMSGMTQCVKAIQARDWRAAAQLCHRAAPISDERNRATAERFLEAA